MRAFALPALLLLAACGDDRPPAPSAAESDQLNEVEERLDAAANEKGPESSLPGPSD